MDLVIVVVILQVADDMLPVGRQDITGGSLEALVYLVDVSVGVRFGPDRELTLAQVPVYSSATGA